ncbi:hypothetical protein BG006_001071 [Podila minutissima]|uniref:Tyrosine specific protein phosphatases domain-containing protein n=1 Tax=Podila minutissima TaxID=64525 RepID=A0A9P5VR98_9FUNG|nr:hypothetical protein BG006_001071 [Podila minutissima]
MATFHSLSPPLGSHQNKNAPDLFSVQLELALPQDHFLPAEGIEAQVWTNLIHQRNPEGPEVWAAISMKLSQVIPGSSIAVFTARLLPTGRGDFGLTCRWKSHKDQRDWTWATKTGDEEENLTITVRVPRSISASSWALGPQSVLVYGADGPRQDGGRGVGGPGLYLGNHAAATRARISGYESVLSLVGDLLDFDEKIPESDKDVNKKAWLEQQATQKATIGGSVSRSNSLSGFGSNMSLADLQGEDKLSHSRRTSVGDFMVNYIPGVSSNSVVDIYSVIDTPVDPPRLTRRNSVTDMMVQPPSQASKRAMRVSPSISSIGELDQDKELIATPSKESAATATKSTTPPLNVNNTPKNTQAIPPVSPGKKNTTNAATATAVVPPLSGTGATPTLTKKEKKAATAAASTASAASVASTSSSAAATTSTPAAASTTSGTALPPSSTEKTTPGKVVPQPSSETVPSLAVSTAPTKAEETASTGTQDSQPQPPSSAKVLSGLYRQTWDTQATLSSLSSHANGSTNPLSLNGRSNSQNGESGAKAKPAFHHKVISLAPGAHNRISEAILREAVEFLHKEVSQGKKVLVHCRDGNGRSGSVALAYIAAQTQKLNQEKGRPNQSKGDIYNQSLQEIWKWKCDVYPHRGLRSTLETMEWTL